MVIVLSKLPPLTAKNQLYLCPSCQISTFSFLFPPLFLPEVESFSDVDGSHVLPEQDQTGPSLQTIDQIPLKIGVDFKEKKFK